MNGNVSTADGMDSCCSNGRRNAPHCKCLSLLEQEQSNMLRSLLAEFGVLIPREAGAAVKCAKGGLQEEKPALLAMAIDVLKQPTHQLVAMHVRFQWF